MNVPERPSTDEPQGRRSAWRWLRRLLIVGVVLVVGYFGAAFALSRFLDPVRLADWLEPRLGAALNRDVELGAVEVRLLPFGLRLRELEVSDPTGLAPALAWIEAVDLRVQLVPLFRREVRVDRVTLTGPEIDLQVGAEGRTNFGDLSPESRETTSDEERPFGLDLRSIRIDGGRLRYATQRDSLTLEVVGLEGDAAVRREPGGPWAFDGTSGASLRIERTGNLIFDDVPLQLTFDVAADSEFEGIEIRSGGLRLDQIALELGGRIDRLKEPVRQIGMDLVAEGVPLDQVIALLPDSIRARLPGDAEGVLAGSLRVEGELGPERTPDVEGQVTVTDGRMTTSGGDRLADGVAGEVLVGADGSLRPRIQGLVLGGSASVEGVVTMGPDGRLDLAVRANPDLSLVGSIVELPEGVSASGTVTADIRVTGPLDDPDGLRFAGDAVADGLRVIHPELGVPFEVPEGRLRLDGTRATFQEVPLVLGGDRLVTSGEVQDLMAFTKPDRMPHVRGTVRGRRLSLVRLRATPPADTTLTYGRVAFAHVGGRPVKGRAAEDAAREMGLERPDSIPVAGELRVVLDSLVDRRGVTEAVDALVEFGPSFVRVTDATFRRYGGELRSSIDLVVGADPTEPFSLTFEARDVDAGAFLAATTPLGNLVRGNVSIELNVTGRLDDLLLPTRPSLVGTGRFALTGGGLRTMPITQQLATFLGMEELREPTVRDWSTSFVLEDGGIRMADAAVAGAPGEPRMGGRVGLDGTLDLLTAFDLPVERLDESALERLGVVGTVAARLRERRDVVEAVLRIGGSVFQPSLEADPAAAVETLTAAAQEEAQAEVQRRVDEQKKELEDRATGFLRGLLQRQDTARTPPPDTVAPDTVRPDAVPPDSTRPDTVPPDTVRPDTVPPDTTRPDTIPPDTADSASRSKQRVRIPI